MLQLILSLTVVFLATAYILLVLIRHWQTSSLGTLVGLAACVTLELSDLQALLHPDHFMFWKHTALVAEIWLPVGWLWFGVTYAGQWHRGEVSAWAKLLLCVALVFPLLVLFYSAPQQLQLFYSPDFAEEKILFLLPAGYLLYAVLMCLLVIALFYLERTYVALARPDRWRAKFEIIGVGLVLAVLVVYYSQALLYRSLDMNLIPVRSACLLLALVFMAYSRLYRGEVLRIEVSRTVAYRSVVFFAVGLYLIALGLFGAGMRYLNFSANRTVLVALGLFFGLLLVLALLSEKIRRRIRVFLHKNFYQKKYAYRSEWLNFTTRLASARNREELENGILSFFAETFALRGAGLFLRDQQSGNFHCSAQHEMELNALCLTGELPEENHLRERGWITDLSTCLDTLQGDWEKLHDKGCVFLIPLCFQQRVEGFIVLGARVYAGERLTYEDFDLMKTLAHQAVGVLLSRKLYADLVAANEMAAIGRVSTFVIHDLKNLVSSLALVVDNARDYIEDAEFRADMFETLDSTVEKMNSLITRLQHVKRQPKLNFVTTDLLGLVQATAHMSGHLGLEVAGDSVLAAVDVAELQKVLLNLIHNAAEASLEGQRIGIEVGENKGAFIRVTDSGAGMSAEFIHTRLFKPFETTKEKGMGIGLYQCRQIIEGHGGHIDVQSELGGGTTFTLWLPFES
ncbi:MAG: PEP-CTERM system histidine kinase PrsK [Desulfuromonadaceae bacterium]|nr:PEP-CTERM system histidine kinase PrsK [Desulfuromonas sp.]MDY0185190.1 PEP-CTERM system histidine kinase PrsK [Desulfuromonadaceae bacterium]